MGQNQFLQAVLPQDPGLHLLRHEGVDTARCPIVLRLQAPRLTLGDARRSAIRHSTDRCPGDGGLLVGLSLRSRGCPLNDGD
jgi:hypothetical protein